MSEHSDSKDNSEGGGTVVGYGTNFNGCNLLTLFLVFLFSAVVSRFAIREGQRLFGTTGAVLLGVVGFLTPIIAVWMCIYTISVLTRRQYIRHEESMVCACGLDANKERAQFEIHNYSNGKREFRCKCGRRYTDSKMKWRELQIGEDP